MSLYEWLLFLHLLAAFMLVAGLVAYGVIAYGRGETVVSRTLAPTASALWNAGGLGVIVFGVYDQILFEGFYDQERVQEDLVRICREEVQP